MSFTQPSRGSTWSGGQSQNTALIRVFETPRSRAHYTCWCRCSPESAKSRNPDTHHPRLTQPTLPGHTTALHLSIHAPDNDAPARLELDCSRQRLFYMSCENLRRRGLASNTAHSSPLSTGLILQEGASYTMTNSWIITASLYLIQTRS